MNSRAYLKRYGWKEGEALKEGGLKRPLLVSHKYDRKGVGKDVGDGVAWWERLFDGQLKALDVNGNSKNTKIGKGIMPRMFDPNADKVEASGIAKSESPLYRMFVFGGVMQGTIEDRKSSRKSENKTMGSESSKVIQLKPSESGSRIIFFGDDDDTKKNKKHHHHHKNHHKKRHHEHHNKRHGAENERRKKRQKKQ